jgi:hypothetical protein
MLPIVVFSIFNYNKVYLPNVNTLIFNKDEMTSFRRSSAIPKLTCVPGNGFSNTFDANNACHDFAPSVIQCKNTGIDDDKQITWECQAELSDLFSLGQTVVSCEGYNGPNDPYVLYGSCGLEYQLNLTPKGHRYFNKQFVRHKPVNNYQPFSNKISYANFTDMLMVFIGFPVAMTMIFWCCSHYYPYSGFSNLSTYNTTPMNTDYRNDTRSSSVPPGLRHRTTVTTKRSFTPPASFGRPTFVSNPHHVFNSVHTMPRPRVVRTTQTVHVPQVVHTTQTVHVPQMVDTIPIVPMHPMVNTIPSVRVPQVIHNTQPTSSSTESSTNEEPVNRTVKGFGTTCNR